MLSQSPQFTLLSHTKTFTKRRNISFYMLLFYSSNGIYIVPLLHILYMNDIIIYLSQCTVLRSRSCTAAQDSASNNSSHKQWFSNVCVISLVTVIKSEKSMMALYLMFEVDHKHFFYRKMFLILTLGYVWLRKG